jgi:hypothetical protein
MLLPLTYYMQILLRGENKLNRKKKKKKSLLITVEKVENLF